MKNPILDYTRSKLSILQNLLCAFFVTAVFSLRWANCLPFSGYMPVFRDGDNLGFMGRYLIYAREPFSFPLGIVKGLSFPFHIASISDGSIPLFAIAFKLLSKLYAPFSEFYYFILAELAAVFFTAYLSCLLLNLSGVKSFWLKLLGAVLVALSFPLLFRSSNYYNVTFEVLYFPIYLAYACFYIKVYKCPDRKSLLMFLLIFPIAALIDLYLLFGVLFLGVVCASLNIVEAAVHKNKINRSRARVILLGLILGVFLGSMCLFALGGKRQSQEISFWHSPLEGRHSEGWGYGGGLGGGFHVADMLGIFIPPEDGKDVPSSKKTGPSAYLTKLGFPVTTKNLQDGQYEGFVYMGTVTFLLLVVLIVIKIISFARNYRVWFMKFRLRLVSVLLTGNDFFSPLFILGISAFLLYVISWGYIIHIAGMRFNNIPTPSLWIALIWPKFMIARSLGRFAIPFTLYINLSVVAWLGRSLFDRYFLNKGKRILLVSILMLLIMAHINEVQGYLAPPSKVTYGNDITNAFGEDDRKAIKVMLKNKKALIVVPALRDNLNWSKICYALAFFSNIPISGATVGSGIQSNTVNLKQFDLDIKCILRGGIKEITDRYGEIAIAAPSAIAEEIVKKADKPLRCRRLISQDVAILTLGG